MGTPLRGTRVRAVLLDMEGTLYANGAALPGAVDAVAALRELGVGLRFLTNTDSLTVERVHGQLTEYGFAVRPDEVFSPVVAAGRLLEDEKAVTYGLVSAGLESTLPTVSATGPYTHVVVGDCRDRLDYARLDDAFGAVRAGAKLLALQNGRYFKRPGRDHIDTGALVAALEYATGESAQVLGKPAPAFFQLAAESMGLGARPAGCLVVGDDATTDVRGGHDAGMRTVQVRTGKWADQRADGLTGHADHEIGDIRELAALVSEVNRE